MLAWHLLYEPWPQNPACQQRFVPGRMSGCEPEKILDDWHKQLPAIHSPTDADRLQALRDWLNQAPLTVFYTEVNSEYSHYLPDYLRGAHQALTRLGELKAGARVIVLFACTSSCRSSWWSMLKWRLLHRRRASKLSVAHALPGMRLLRKEDISDWHMSFPGELKKKYDHGRLKSEIYDQVFRQRDDPVRYGDVRRQLIDQQGLVRARKV